MEFCRHTLANGLEIVAECHPRAYTTGVAFLVNAGARDETDAMAGVSHFLEHMAFKGTQRRSAADVNRELDAIGSEANAFTSEEHTVYHCVILPEYLERAVDLLADMLRPALREEDFVTEKEVIVGEICKYDNQPPYRAPELCMADYFAGHPLGRSVLGSVESVRGLTPESMRSYFESRYVPNNIVLAAAGRVDFDQLVRWAEERCGSWPAAATTRDVRRAAPQSGFRVITNEKATQQYVCSISPGPAAEDEGRFAASILSAVLGDDTGSRFFWELVDTGRADWAAMGADEYQGSGAILTYMSCPPDLAGENLQAIRDIQRDVEAQGITAEELEQAQNKICSHLVRASERPASRLFAVGGDWLARRQYLSVRDVINAYRAVTLDDIRALLERFPLTLATTVTVGPLESVAEPQ